MLPEYDFKSKKGARGKYAKAMKKGYSVRILDEDGTVETHHFVPKESVNHALRTLIELVPAKSGKRVAE